MRGGLAQQLPLGLRARGRRQLLLEHRRRSSCYQQNLYDATQPVASHRRQPQRQLGGFVLTARPSDGRDMFNSADNSSSTATRRCAVSFSRGERRSALAALLRRQQRVRHARAQHAATHDEVDDDGLTRARRHAGRSACRSRKLAVPHREPSSRGATPTTPRAWTTASAVAGAGRLIRRYFDFQPDRRAGVQPHLQHADERLCREVQAHHRADFTIQRVTAIDNFDRRSCELDGTDIIVGGTTRFSYGDQQPLLVRQKSGRCRRRSAVARDPHSSAQTYYTDALAAQYDPASIRPASAAARRATSRRSRCSVRATPTDAQRFRPSGIDGVRLGRSRSNGISASGSVNCASVQATVGWSQRGSSPICRLQRPDTRRPLLQRRRPTFAARTTASAAPTRSTTTSQRSDFLQQRLSRLLQRAVLRHRVEYQTYNYPAALAFPASPRTGGSTSRSRSPASARSPTSSAPSAASSRVNERTDPQRRQGHAAAPADLHQRQAARAGRQQAGALLRHRGAGRGRHPRHRHRRRRHAGGDPRGGRRRLALGRARHLHRAGRAARPGACRADQRARSSAASRS